MEGQSKLKSLLVFVKTANKNSSFYCWFRWFSKKSYGLLMLSLSFTSYKFLLPNFTHLNDIKQLPIKTNSITSELTHLSFTKCLPTFNCNIADIILYMATVAGLTSSKHRPCILPEFHLWQEFWALAVNINNHAVNFSAKLYRVVPNKRKYAV